MPPRRAALLALALPFACASATPPHRYPGPAPTSAEDRAVARLAERFLDLTLALDPVAASALGYPKYNGRLPDYTPEGVADAQRVLEQLSRDLARPAKSRMSRPYAVDHDLMVARLAELRFFYGELRPFASDPRMYVQQVGAGLYHLTLPPEDPADWPDRLAAIVDRLEALPGFLATAEARLERPAAVNTDFAIAQNPGNLRTVQDTLPPLFAAHPKLAARFAAARPGAERALTRFQAFLEDTLRPRSDGDWRLGPERYAKKLTHTLGTTLSPRAVFEGAERGLTRARWQMYDVAIPLFRAAFPEDRAHLDLVGDARIDYVVGKVIAEASARHGTAESLFADVERSAARVQAWLRAEDFVDLPPPTDRFVIEPTPPFLDGLAVAFYNPAPAFAPGLKKSFWISSVPAGSPEETESFLREYNPYILDALTIHEAFPGHYVQMYWSSHAPDASLVKRVLDSGTMAEGWAMMVEQLMHEAGWGADDPRQLLFHLKMRLRIFVNAMIDVRLHTATGEDADALDRWALDLMTTKGFQEEAEATRKLVRAKLTSAQLSTYYVGYREMLALYRELVAAGMAPKAARMKMLRYGTIPPGMIRQLVAQDGLLK